MNDLHQQLRNLTPGKRQLLEILLKEQGVDLGQACIVPQSRDSEYYPLSFSQQRLWFLNELEPGSPLYNNPAAVRLVGHLDASALERSLNEIVRRHELLRTTFTTVDGKPVQRVSPQLSLPLPVVDLRMIPDSEREEEVTRLAVQEARRPFDLSHGPLLRVTLLRLSDDEHVVLLNMHHIVSDGWSIGVLLHEIAALYEAFSQGRPSPLPELPIQYIDFAIWQRNWLQGDVRDEQLGYWKQQLAGELPVVELPTDRPRPPYQTFRGAFETLTIPQEIAAALAGLSRQEDATPFMTLLAAFTTLLYRYCDQTDIILGSPIANRNRTEVEDLIGFFVNTLVLRCDLSGDPTFRELLSRVREVTLGAYAHQDLPFEMLVEELRPERDMSRSPLFQVMFVLNNAPMRPLELPGLRMSLMEVDTGTAKFDIVLSLTEANEGLRGKLEYNIDLFDRSTIVRMIRHFERLLQGIAADPDQRLCELPLLTDEEQQQLLKIWNHTQEQRTEKAYVHQLFELQALQSPKAVAVVCEQDRLTYGDLNRRANQLAHRLRALGVGAEVPVGLCVERSVDLIVGLLGILKAGGVYVPLDPSYPKERLAYMIDDSGLSVLLTHKHLVGSLPEHLAQVVQLDSDWPAISMESAENPDSDLAPQNAAYLIYTSGSTGQPKGVMVSHGTLAEHCVAIREYYELTHQDRVLQFAAFNFDASLEQILPTLIAGAALVVRGPDIWSISEFPARIHEYGLTVVNLPTAYWAQLAREWVGMSDPRPANDLRLVIVGGDRMSSEALRLWRQTPAGAARLLNAYGPTEATITATTFEVAADFEQTKRPEVPIGRPVSGRKAYILDAHGRPVPVGVAGELYLGGAGLARGYRSRPDWTADRFVPDPFSDVPGARLYRTGDRARYLPDGHIEFLGRVDHQVKIRGFRVETGEIEAVLRQHPSLRDVVVVARADGAADRRLVAYVVAEAGDRPTVSDLHRFLKDRLPEFMIPSAFVFLDALPQTPAGKIDRRALPAPEQFRPELEAKYVAPRTATEQLLAEIVANTLGLERVGIYDNFFELGGHSMLAIQVISRVRETFHVDVPLRSLFESPTVAGLALAIARCQAEEESAEELDKMLAELEDLSDEQVRALLSEEDGLL